jgi:hypothetical protein
VTQHSEAVAPPSKGGHRIVLRRSEVLRQTIRELHVCAGEGGQATAIPGARLERAYGERHRLIRIHRSKYLGDRSGSPQRCRCTGAVAALDGAAPLAKQPERGVASALRPALDARAKLVTRRTVVTRRQRVDGFWPRVGVEARANES